MRQKLILRGDDASACSPRDDRIGVDWAGDGSDAPTGGTPTARRKKRQLKQNKKKKRTRRGVELGEHRSRRVQKVFRATKRAVRPGPSSVQPFAAPRTHKDRTPRATTVRAGTGSWTVSRGVSLQLGTHADLCCAAPHFTAAPCHILQLRRTRSHSVLPQKCQSPETLNSAALQEAAPCVRQNTTSAIGNQATN